MIVPTVLTLPVLLTASVNTPGLPTVKLPVCVFAIASRGVPLIAVGSLAVGVLLAPPPLAVARVHHAAERRRRHAHDERDRRGSRARRDHRRRRARDVWRREGTGPAGAARRRVGEAVGQRVADRDRPGCRGRSGVAHGDRVRAGRSDGEAAGVRFLDREDGLRDRSWDRSRPACWSRRRRSPRRSSSRSTAVRRC